MKIRITTHKPNPVLWLIAFLLFVYALLPFGLPYQAMAMPAAVVLLLVGTTII